ncbi:hypothetical protein BLNAU_6654 [Blattamonas nauphoetae]|uniref:Uncharacterized protein n=1 Tax=Blattamonas nauphoetae TaxID=2049346 RepID=A0ABQ9Y3U9_9EUKA|nr:hypothetical protein BLNAU_6654 [Blattamonas nauphoetae]
MCDWPAVDNFIYLSWMGTAVGQPVNFRRCSKSFTSLLCMFCFLFSLLASQLVFVNYVELIRSSYTPSNCTLIEYSAKWAVIPIEESTRGICVHTFRVTHTQDAAEHKITEITGGRCTDHARDYTNWPLRAPMITPTDPSASSISSVSSTFQRLKSIYPHFFRRHRTSFKEPGNFDSPVYTRHDMNHPPYNLSQTPQPQNVVSSSISYVNSPSPPRHNCYINKHDKEKILLIYPESQSRSIAAFLFYTWPAYIFFFLSVSVLIRFSIRALIKLVTGGRLSVEEQAVADEAEERRRASRRAARRRQRQNRRRRQRNRQNTVVQQTEDNQEIDEVSPVEMHETEELTTEPYLSGLSTPPLFVVEQPTQPPQTALETDAVQDEGNSNTRPPPRAAQPRPPTSTTIRALRLAALHQLDVLENQINR